MGQTKCTICILALLSVKLFKGNYAENTKYVHLKAQASTHSSITNLNLTCNEGSEYTHDQYSWTKEPFSQEHDHRQIIIERDSKYEFLPSSKFARILQIKNVTIKDEGSYCCFKAKSSCQRMFNLKVYHDIENMQIVSMDGVQTKMIGTAGEEFRVGCIASKSWPAAMISMRIDGSPLVALQPMLATFKASPDINGLYRTELYFRTNSLHKWFSRSRLLICEASLHDLHVKRQTFIPLSVQYSPICARLENPFRLGLNRMGNITCGVSKVNPSKNLRFEWLLDRGNLAEKWNVHFMFTNENSSTILVKPTSLSQLENAHISCSISNGIGTPTICNLPVALGTKPDPVTNCHHSYPTNTTVQISCQLGFHQGDPNQQCVLFRLDKQKQMMIEYARARLCAFIIDRTSRTEYHKLKVFSINKFGDSFQQAVTFELNSFGKTERAKSSSYILSFFRSRYRSIEKIIAVFILIAGLFLVACLTSMCCCCCCQDGSWLSDKLKIIGDWKSVRSKTRSHSVEQQKAGMEMFWDTYARRGNVCFIKNNYSGGKFIGEESHLLNAEQSSMQNNVQSDMILN
ncbi:hypothetical protein ACOME3_008627 [Neoechinorhynchus agilis]